MSNFFMNKWRHVLLIVAAGFFVILPTMIMGIPKGDDIEHHYRVGVSLYESIRQGEFHPGWNSLSTDGYGDVSFRFYPPLFYYLMSVARLIVGNWYAASLFVFALLSILGGLSSYYWVRTFLEPELALFAGLFFVVSPFYVSELYQFAMLPQYAACALLPFAFAFLELVCQTGKWRNVIGLAVAYAMLVLTHLPLTVIGSIALAIYALFRIKRPAYLKSLLRLTVGVLLGLASSSFYWVRMISELEWRRGTRGEPGFWYDYRYNFIFGNTVDSTTVWWATKVAFATVLMGIPALVLLRTSWNDAAENNTVGQGAAQGPCPGFDVGENHSSGVKIPERRCPPYKALAVLTIISFFMMVPLSRPIWFVLPFLKEIQLPWRWLTIASMFCAVLGAASLRGLLELAKGKLRPFAILAAGGLLIPISLTMFQVIRGANFLSHSAFDQMIRLVPSSPSLPDWLPVWARTQPKSMSGQVEASNRQIQITSWRSDHRIFQIGAGTAQEARLKTYYYPLWIATADGKPLETRPAEDGALLVALPAEAVTVDVILREPERVRASNIVSALAWGLIGVFFVWLRIRNGHSNPPLE
jgi:hypothetical protein